MDWILIARYILTGCIILGSLLNLFSIGQERKPLTTGVWLGAALLQAVLVYLLWH